MKTLSILRAIALTPAMFILAETTPPAHQPSVNTTPSIATVQRAGGVKRGLLQRQRPQVASDLVSEPSSRSRAGGVKRNRLHPVPGQIPRAASADVEADTARPSHPSTATVQRAGGVKRGLLQRQRPQVASDLVSEARESTTRRRAGGTKRRF